MENWLYDKATMDLVSGHYRTGESLPDGLFEKVCKGRLRRKVFCKVFSRLMPRPTFRLSVESARNIWPISSKASLPSIVYTVI